MKKLPLLITIGIVVIIVGGYYLYSIGFNKNVIQQWDLVPGDAIIVYESDVCDDCLKEVKESSLWKIIDQSSFYREASDSLKRKFTRFLNEKNKYLISVHATKKDDFDFIFYGNLSAADFSALTQELDKNYKSGKRVFNEVSINEISFAQQTLSWTILDNVWVASFTPFLIEDVIRTYSFGDTDYKKNLGSVNQFNKIKGDAGNLYVKLNSISQYFTLFSKEYSPLLESFGKSSILDIKTEGNNIILNGFSSDSVDNAQYALSIFKNQKPVTFNLKRFVSNRVLAISDLGISNGDEFFKDLSRYRKTKSPHLSDTVAKLGSSLQINFEKLYQNISDEVALCFVESAKKNRVGKILMIETKKSSSWLNAFDKLSSRLSVDTIFYERFGNYEIREIPLFRFPEKLFFPFVTGFNESFYTTAGNTIIVGDDIEDLKSFLTDIEEDDTWGKSVSFNRFLETTLLESNISFYVNTPKVWNSITDNFHPRWSKFILDNKSLVRSLQFGAIQFSNLNNSYYTNIAWAYKQFKPTTEPVFKREKYVTHLEAGILGIHSVKSHVNKSDELLVQDSLNNINLINTEGQVLWKISVADPIVGEVHQIDFFANGKLQYFFATRDALHIIDRLGNYINPYPLRLSITDVLYTSVVDYDHSKKYRFLIGDASGKIWMYDKEGKNLEGWNPKEIGIPLAMTPKHYRIKGKDYVISVARNGLIHLTNRRGELIKNFPLSLNVRLSGEYFLETGKTLADTYFVFVDEDGFKIKVNIEGKVASRETLLKTSVSSKFSLIAEKHGRAYLLLQKDARQFSLFDESGKKIVSNEFIGFNSSKVDYYDFGSGRTYLSIVDLTQNLAYIYDGNGNLLTSPPIETSALTIRPKDSDELLLFYVSGKSIVIQPL